MGGRRDSLVGVEIHASDGIGCGFISVQFDAYVKGVQAQDRRLVVVEPIS